MESETDAPPSGVLLKHTKHGKGGTLKRSPSFLERQAAERSRVTMETSGLSATHYNHQCVKKGAFEGHEKDRYIRSRGSEPTDESSSLESGGRWVRVPGFQAGSREWAEPEPPPAQRREKGQVSPLSPASLSSLPFSLFYNLKKPMTDKVSEGRG